MQRTSFFPLLSLFLLLASIPLSVRPHRYVRATDMLFSQKANGRHVRLIPRIIFFQAELIVPYLVRNFDHRQTISQSQCLAVLTVLACKKPVAHVMMFPLLIPRLFFFFLPALCVCGVCACLSVIRLSLPFHPASA